MVPEFASNVAHCGNILVSLIRLRPRVKLSTRTTHILCSNRLAHLVFKMWHVRTLDALVGEYDREQDSDDEPAGLEYSSGEDSDMDMGEEMPRTKQNRSPQRERLGLPVPLLGAEK